MMQDDEFRAVLETVELLESDVAGRTRELSGLLEVSRAITGTLELQPLLGLILDRLRDIVEYADAFIMLVEGDELCVAEYRGRHHRQVVLARRIAVVRTEVFQAVLRRDGPVIYADVSGDRRPADVYLAEQQPGADGLAPPIRCILGVPLKVKDRVIGQIRLDHTQAGFYRQTHAELAAAIANQAAVAIANARLFAEAEGRGRALEALYRAEEALHRSLEPQEVLQALVDGATDMIRADAASVLLWDAAHERISVQAARGFDPQLVRQMSYARGEGISAQVATSGEVIIVDDLLHDPRLSPRIRAINAAANIRSVISVPIELGGEVFGVYNVHSIRPRRFSSSDCRLLVALAQRAAVALANARLFEGERLTRERLEVAVAAGRLGTWEWDIPGDVVTWSTELEAIHGLAPGTFAGTFEAYVAHVHADDRALVVKTINESLQRGELHVEYRIVWRDGTTHWFEASGRVTRDAHGTATDMRGVCRDVTARKQGEIERARLRERERAASEARAALEERQRLARELHDSVSQALYGIALGTQTVLAALDEGGGAEGRAAGDAARYVLDLAEASIAEMRALIFELRPEWLAQEGLVGALERQVASLRARHALQVEAHLGPEPAVALEVKEALYRIAQEGMHNVVKHAHASALRLSLRQTEHDVVMEIVDDGVGFAPNGASPGHLGLTSMRERAAGLGADLRIDSTPGRGTRLVVVLPSDTITSLMPAAKQGDGE